MGTIAESPPDDLQGKPERIRNPAALRRLRTGLDKAVPVLIDLGLVPATEVEREAL